MFDEKEIHFLIEVSSAVNVTYLFTIYRCIDLCELQAVVYILLN